VHAASLSTLKEGAQTGMPTASEVDEFMTMKGY
jgi:sugar/nucleoside kinase (ribokinase family)